MQNTQHLTSSLSSSLSLSSAQGLHTGPSFSKHHNGHPLMPPSPLYQSGKLKTRDLRHWPKVTQEANDQVCNPTGHLE